MPGELACRDMGVGIEGEDRGCMIFALAERDGELVDLPDEIGIGGGGKAREDGEFRHAGVPIGGGSWSAGVSIGRHISPIPPPLARAPDQAAARSRRSGTGVAVSRVAPPKARRRAAIVLRR